MLLSILWYYLLVLDMVCGVIGAQLDAFSSCSDERFRESQSVKLVVSFVRSAL